MLVTRKLCSSIYNDTCYISPKLIPCQKFKPGRWFLQVQQPTLFGLVWHQHLPGQDCRHPALGSLLLLSFPRSLYHWNDTAYREDPVCPGRATARHLAAGPPWSLPMETRGLPGGQRWGQSLGSAGSSRALVALSSLKLKAQITSVK